MPTIDRRIPLLLALGMALAMLAITGWQSYELWQTETDRALPAMATEATSEAQTASSVPDVELAELALFGTASSTPGTSEPSTSERGTQNLPETNLRLVLRGVMAADGESPGSALIEDPDGETNSYMVGDSLPGDALLRTVLPNRVILERDGKLENLYFPEADDWEGASLVRDEQADSPAPSEQSPASSPDTAPDTAPNTDQATDSSSDDQDRREEIRSRLEQLRQQLQDDN